MGGVGMAITAIRDDIVAFGWMTDMTVHAAYFFLVRTTGGSNILGRLIMTFHAVTGQELNPFLVGLRPCRHSHKNTAGNYPYQIFSTAF